MVKPSASEDITTFAVTEILALPKASKSASPEHRVALYTMINFIPPSLSASRVAESTTPVLLSKETNDPALNALCASISGHLIHLLGQGQALDKGVVAALVKESTSTKAATRRALWSLLGSIFWKIDDVGNTAVQELATALLPALESNLKAVSAISPNSPGLVLEGYVAVSSLLRSIASWAPEKTGERKTS